MLSHNKIINPKNNIDISLQSEYYEKEGNGHLINNKWDREAH